VITKILIGVAIWLGVWLLWYRLEWKTEARDNPQFTDDDRRDIFIGALTWPIQVVILLIGVPILLVVRALRSKKAKKE
jgi:hypothetical protein